MIEDQIKSGPHLESEPSRVGGTDSRSDRSYAVGFDCSALRLWTEAIGTFHLRL